MLRTMNKIRIAQKAMERSMLGVSLTEKVHNTKYATQRITPLKSNGIRYSEQGNYR